jgi:hypothetical protein
MRDRLLREGGAGFGPGRAREVGRRVHHPVLAREYGVTDADGKQQSAFWDSTWPAPGAFRSYTLGAATDRVTVRLA